MENREIITPGEMIYDIEGQPINAHGGGILKQDDIYYFYGEYRPAKSENKAQSAKGVSCYSSANLIDWKFEGLVLPTVSDTTSLIQEGCKIERPKVIYNEKNDQYVMWFHHELIGQKYDAAMTGLAVSSSPTGPFTYLKSLRPNAGVWPANYPDSLKNKKFTAFNRNDHGWRDQLVDGSLLHRDFEGGQMARDMTLFQVGDNAYHIHAAEENFTLHISELNEDYTDFTDNYIRILPGGHNEAPALFNYMDKLYMITSGCTGWTPNAGRLSVATDIMGDWEALGNPVVGTPEEMENTFLSQSTFILPFQNGFIYMGDRWQPNSLITSEYVWLPISFEEEIPFLSWKDEWSLKKIEN